MHLLSTEIGEAADKYPSSTNHTPAVINSGLSVCVEKNARTHESSRVRILGVIVHKAKQSQVSRKNF